MKKAPTEKQKLDAAVLREHYRKYPQVEVLPLNMTRQTRLRFPRPKCPSTKGLKGYPDV